MKPEFSASATLFQLLGEHLPQEVFQHLSTEELEKLLTKVSNKKKSSASEETGVLHRFLKQISKNGAKLQTLVSNKSQTPENEFVKNSSKGFPTPEKEYSKISKLDLESILLEMENILSSDQEVALEDILENASPEEWKKILAGESIESFARVISNVDPKTGSEILNSLSEDFQEKVLLSILNNDYSTSLEIDTLIRFIGFKKKLLQKGQSTLRMNNSQKAKIGNILENLDSKNFLKTFEKIAETSSEKSFAYYLSWKDLLRTEKGILELLKSIHPYVFAVGLKGSSMEFRENFLNLLPVSDRNRIRKEEETLGPVTLGEIEIAQKGILEFLRKCLDDGKFQLV